MELSRERRGQIEPEAVHVHLEHPVAQAVHDELDRARVHHVERVAAARVVDVAAPVPAVEAIVGGIVDAPEAERRPEVIALGGVVVHDVQDDLDARLVERLHHRLEFSDLGAPGAAREYRASGAKKPIEL